VEHWDLDGKFVKVIQKDLRMPAAVHIRGDYAVFPELKGRVTVIGKDGNMLKGGVWVFDRNEAARFMGLVPGELPLGMRNGQIADHWKTTNEWWVRFGQAGAMHDWHEGVALAPLAAAAGAVDTP